MKCLKCEKETLNENQICDECAKFEEQVNKKQEEKTEKVETLPNKHYGKLAMIFGITSAVLFVFGSLISSIIASFPAMGAPIAALFNNVSNLAKPGLAIAAIILGCKSKNTAEEKMGKIGKIFGIVMVIVIPVWFVIATIWNTLMTMVIIAIFVIILLLAFLPQIGSIIGFIFF